MNLLKSAKRLTLATKGLGLFPVVAESNWRRQRLLILCYHGVAVGEEALVHPEMFMLPATFARRMEILESLKFQVIGLSEALRLLETGKLPARSVALTFDDGWADFRSVAFPILQKRAFPATVYLTTYYCTFNRPVFRFALSYIASKRKHVIVSQNDIPWLPKRIELSTPHGRSALVREIDAYVKETDMSAKQKDQVAADFASLLGFDYQELVRQRLFHLMSPQEVTEMAHNGIDFQLHTHRHRTPLNRAHFVQEIEQNRQTIQDLAGTEAHHFCYPSGAYRPEFLPWLSDVGVQSATTCDHGYCNSASNPLLLPRVLDQIGISDAEFEAWITGFAAFIPHRRVVRPDLAPE